MNAETENKYPWAGPALFIVVACGCLAFFIWIL